MSALPGLERRLRQSQRRQGVSGPTQEHAAADTGAVVFFIFCFQEIKAVYLYLDIEDLVDNR